MKTSKILKVRATGPLAIFSRPELKAERMTYPVPTPSALRGLLEAVFWKPAIQWHIRAIHVLAPVRFHMFRRNEVKSKASAPPAATLKSGGTAPELLIEEDRAQRNTVALRDVDYGIEACLSLTDRAGPEENVKKFEEMFCRRVEKGQHFHQPYFGCRECIADVLRWDDGDSPPPLAESQNLGLMLWDIEFGQKRNTPVFFHAVMKDGIIQVPPTAEAARATAAAFAAQSSSL